ncbi:rhodanese-like domain-containing protein [Pullulanibacillus sp. KACC 23026]|uniref:rhodanese-like domain-containing protein n=1 Tax=Pullulanibacillus sp. KACC 23026 TaxID=3028315 RepID=UPI0023B10DCD|nr:rhodanese-like domain-containing protein [Pullulanibacillus sp. KACC 23026]WEG14924.1 rhodanese-like domain-containing protein [Pullulanibacillus sp. KACC 23026]
MAWIVLIILIVAAIAYSLTRMLMQRRYLKTLTQEEFIEGYRKVQLIDVREPNEFENGHILGARNVPLTQFKMRKQEIRKDKPVYLYCQNGTRSTRAAALLRKYGCQEIYMLKGGFKQWTGKVKSKNA